jgi:hypothetical protein
MKKLLFLIVASLALTGCAHNYLVTLNNGSQVTATTKPRLERGYYFFKDSQGRNSYVAAGRVREISAGGEVKKDSFNVPPAK